MTESEEMYLVSVLKIKESGEDGPIPLTRLAAEMDIAPVSVNQMVRKLGDAGWLTYTPYKGVDLTETGSTLGLRVLRHRRLWEVFLAEKLKINAQEAEELACKMEHFLPDGAAERLADFLGHPTINPRGLPIPVADSTAAIPGEIALSVLALDETGEIVGVNAESSCRSFLQAENLIPGSLVRILGLGSGGSMLLQMQDGSTIHLSASMAQVIWVRKNK